MADTTFPQSGGSAKYQLIVKTDTGSTVTATKGSVTKTAKEKNGIWGFKGLSAGEWTITATLDGASADGKVNIVEGEPCQVLELKYSWIPEFTYTGTYKLVDDSDNEIVTPQIWKSNFKIRFLTSGVLRFSSLSKAKMADVFLVGGGGNGAQGNSAAGADNGAGGGGGGYTKTHKNVELITDFDYEVVIGGSGGGNTSAFGFTANGGKNGGGAGGAGGSGGGGGCENGAAKANSGGSDGSDGESGSYGGGKGQGTTTREFGVTTGTLYSGGGGATGGRYNSTNGRGGAGGGGDSGEWTNHIGVNGTTNLGGGGGSGWASGGLGGSGIVIIRNARG